MDRFSYNLEQQFWPQQLQPVIQESLVVPDMYLFVRDAIFRAEVEALYGKNLFIICPSICDDFWKFYDAFPVVSRGGPRWPYPSKYRTRDRMLENLHSWRKWCNSNSHHDNEELGNSEHNPVWGTRYVRDMVRRHEELGFSDAGISSVMLGFLFV